MSKNQQEEELATGVNPTSEIDDDVEKRKKEEQRKNEWLKEKMEFRRKQQVQFIMTQTNYDEMEATQRLEECNNDVMRVVSEYLGIGIKKDENVKKTKNQKVFSVIREIMDSGSRNFIAQQEKAKKIEELKKYMEMKNKQSQQNVVVESSSYCGDNNHGNDDDNLKSKKEKQD